jgi:hypothetical protein
MVRLTLIGLIAVLGLIVATFAPQISHWEKRMADRYPFTKVTGWSGTPRGIFVWRVIGALVIVRAVLELAFLHTS